MIRKFIVGLVLAVVSIAGLSTVAGATPTACAVGDNGWYWHGNKVMQCVVDGNHMLIQQYGAGGVNEGVVLDAWYPSAYSYYWITPSSPYGGTSLVAFCPTTWVGVNTVLTTTGAPGWEQRFNTLPNGGVGGAINHWKFGTHAYTKYQHLVSGNCPFGGSATAFYDYYA